MKLPGAVSNARVPERLRALGTLLNLHYAGAGVLLLLSIYLLAALVLAWRTASTAGANDLAQAEVARRTADLQARPLQGLDNKLATSRFEADSFYTRRLPGSYSEVLTELGALTKREGVKLTRVQYAQAPVLDGTAGALTEVRMDASLTGDYRPLVLFLNALERDRMFFVIGGLTLTGQQSGTVGLRLRLTTYLRPGAVLEPDASVSSLGLSGAPAYSTSNSPGGLSSVPVAATDRGLSP